MRTKGLSCSGTSHVLAWVGLSDREHAEMRWQTSALLLVGDRTHMKHRLQELLYIII